MRVSSLYELYLDNVIRQSSAIKWGVLVGVGALIGVLGYRLVLKAPAAQLAGLTTQALILKKDFEAKQLLVSSLQADTVQLARMQAQATSLIKSLPAKHEIPRLLESISVKGGFYGLKFVLFAPQEEIAHAFYVELPIKIIVEGAYFQLVSFLSAITTMKQIITLQELGFTSRLAEDSTTTVEEVLRMHLTAKIYRYRTS